MRQGRLLCGVVAFTGQTQSSSQVGRMPAWLAFFIPRAEKGQTEQKQSYRNLQGKKSPRTRGPNDGVQMMQGSYSHCGIYPTQAPGYDIRTMCPPGNGDSKDGRYQCKGSQSSPILACKVGPCQQRLSHYTSGHTYQNPKFARKRPPEGRQRYSGDHSGGNSKGQQVTQDVIRQLEPRKVIRKQPYPEPENMVGCFRG
jgi:hypothetical protein